MTPDLHRTLTAWLESGTEAQKFHAHYRLSLPAATDELSPMPFAIAPHPDDVLVTARGLRACPYGAPAGPSCCNALATVCHWKGRLVLACDCLDCLSPSSAPAPTED